MICFQNLTKPCDMMGQDEPLWGVSYGARALVEHLKLNWFDLDLGPPRSVSIIYYN